MDREELVNRMADAIFRLRSADRNVKSSDLARAALAAAEPAVRADEAIMSAVSCEASAFNARAINDHSVGAVFAEVFETQAKRFREHAEAIRTGGTP